MSEDKEKMRSMVYKLERKGKARIYKLLKIRVQFQSKFNSFSANTKFRLDFSAYKNIQQTRVELFSSLFSISKRKYESVVTNVKIDFNI